MRMDLIRKREAKGLTQTQMAMRCDCSLHLIRGIEEEDWITHPMIAAVMAKQYRFGIRTFNRLVHESKREKTLPEPPKKRKWGGYAKWYWKRGAKMPG